jgi:hypothetical protein
MDKQHIMCTCPDCRAGEDSLCSECARDWPCDSAKLEKVIGNFADFVEWVDKCDPSITDSYIIGGSKS